MAENLPTVALSIRQPWAWLIVNGYKDIENRSWFTKFRGRIWVHAAKALTKSDYEWVVDFIISNIKGGDEIPIPAFKDLERGGIVGSVYVNGCCGRSESPWFFGPFGFELINPSVVPFRPCRGMLGFFTPQFERDEKDESDQGDKREIPTSIWGCARCEGRGWVPSNTNADTDPCPKCLGSGTSN